ncbi:MAG TPA: peptide chain release factor 2 [Thermodesulfobacteriota bacterium]|nr:peptide chain release factor 2 [Thermodesulfobacteriota bacterium]
MLAEAREALDAVTARLSRLGRYLDLEAKRARLAELDRLINDPAFFRDRERAERVLRERSAIQADLDAFDRLERERRDAAGLLALADEEGDEAVARDVARLLAGLEARIGELELARVLSGEHDAKNAIVSIHPGAGGTESQDWAEMLLRMYLRYCERRGWATELVDYQAGEEAGLKSATFVARGPYAYGYLKAEAGVHRLVRISPFDAAARRHTSFASVFVFPELPDDIVVEIDEKDLRIETFRSSGAGGQHVNKTESAVRITHLPTGIVVSCQNERSQHKNRAMAMKILRARLYEHERQKQAQQHEALHAGKKEIGFGSQIRSYVLHPYRLVKDHRTGVEVGNADAVLDGDLAPFIDAYLLGQARPSEGRSG